MRTILELSRRLNEGRPFPILLGDFLDEFYRSEDSKRLAMIEAAPEPINGPEHLGPFLAATAHKLANDHCLTPPDWAFEARFFLPGGQPYFGGRATKGLRACYLRESPGEFAHRNIFVSHNCLSRA